jgi:hypothetical protein
VSGITKTLSDSGVSSDTLTVTAIIPLADSGIGTDSVLNSIAAILTDSGLGADSLGVITGSVPKTLTDSGTGADSLVITTAIVYLADMGEGIDGVVQYVRMSESGQGSDSVFLAVSASLADSGQGYDVLQAWPVSIISLSDAGAGTDSLVALPDNTNTVTLSDSGSGADTLSVVPVVSLTDTGHGSDVMIVSAQIWLGYDDPVAEHHEPFDPFEPDLSRLAEAMADTRPYSLRTGMVVVPQVWRMTPDEFTDHMKRMHSGHYTSWHKGDHANGKGGNPTHIHR